MLLLFPDLKEGPDSLMSCFYHLRFCERKIFSVLTFLPASLTVRRMEISMVQSLVLQETLRHR